MKIVFWFERQFSRIKKFVKAIPRMKIQTGGYLKLLKLLAYYFFFFGFHGLKVFCKPYLAHKDEKESAIVPHRFLKSLTYLKELQTRILTGTPDFDTRKKGYLVYAPDYTPNSAGIKCLYQLCHDLNQKGFPSFIVGSNKSAPDLVAPLLGERQAKKFVLIGFIAVYPETISGNPLKAKTVARWVLNRPGLLGGDKIYDKGELVFNYTSAFSESIQNEIAGKLYMPTIDESIFYHDASKDDKRSLECFYIGKSKWQDGFFERDEVFEITRDSPQKKELGKLFRSAKRLYCFDNSTILVYEAILCGCPVVIIPDGTQKRVHYESSELGIDGIAWGVEEIDRAEVNLTGLTDRYKKVKVEYQNQLELFIEVSQAGKFSK